MGVFFTGVDTPRSQVNIEIGGRGGIEINDGILTMFMRWALFSRTPESFLFFIQQFGSSFWRACRPYFGNPGRPDVVATAIG